MRFFVGFVCLFICSISNGQINQKISTIDFVQILDGHKAEAIFYYEHNWKVLRDSALVKGFIDAYQLLETSYHEDSPFHLMLITTYKNESQYKLREQHFNVLIEEKGALSLLNEMKPGAFRKGIYNKEGVTHLE